MKKLFGDSRFKNLLIPGAVDVHKDATRNLRSPIPAFPLGHNASDFSYGSHSALDAPHCQNYSVTLGQRSHRTPARPVCTWMRPTDSEIQQPPIPALLRGHLAPCYSLSVPLGVGRVALKTRFGGSRFTNFPDTSVVPVHEALASRCHCISTADPCLTVHPLCSRSSRLDPFEVGHVALRGLVGNL